MNIIKKLKKIFSIRNYKELIEEEKKFEHLKMLVIKFASDKASPNANYDLKYVSDLKKCTCWEDLKKLIEFRLNMFIFYGFEHMPDDIYTSYHINGVVDTIIEYKNGVKHGEKKIFYDDGQLKESSNWKRGKVHGYYQNWNRNGLLNEYQLYENGKLIKNY